MIFRRRRGAGGGAVLRCRSDAPAASTYTSPSRTGVFERRDEPGEVLIQLYPERRVVIKMVLMETIPITEARQVASVVEKFREKYGAGDVKKYYSKLDAAVLAQMP